MSRKDLSNEGSTLTGAGIQSNDAKRYADSFLVPFVLRAWWLREFEESKELQWCDDAVVSQLWSNYSDPLCDMGELEDPEDL
jgi:hypothetical protein